MGETIHFSEKYMQRLMKGFDVASLTDGLYNHEIDQEFSGVRTVHVNNILTTPLQKYDRTKNIDTGSRYGTTYEVSDDTQTFEMGDEISLSLTIDRANNSDQFNMKKAGDVMQAYKEERIIPYLDKYRMDHWANGCGMTYGMDAEPTVDTIAKVLIKARNAQKNKRVTGKTALLIRYDYLDVLALSSQWVKIDKLGEQTLVKGTVGQFYGMDVVPFVNDLMPEKAWFMMINPKACIAPKKLNRFVAHVDPPRVNGDLLEFLMYHDAFVLGKKADGILVGSMAENICATPTISVTSKKATITTTTTTAQIYYTLNGADPRYSKDAKLYTDAVQLTSGDQLRACAKKDGMYTSGVAAEDQT